MKKPLKELFRQGYISKSIGKSGVQSIHRTIASGIKERKYVILEHGFGKVLVLQHPKGLVAGLGALFCIRIV